VLTPRPLSWGLFAGEGLLNSSEFHATCKPVQGCCNQLSLFSSTLGQENNIAAETALEIQKEVLIPIQVTLWD
jgi:hypothetical protein